MNKLNFLTMLIYGLSTFRLAVLLSQDDGPGHLILKLRSMLKREAKKNTALRKTYVHEGVECLRCSSIWLAIPIASYAYFRRYFVEWVTAGCDIFLVAMSLSALAILFQRAFPPKP